MYVHAITGSSGSVAMTYATPSEMPEMVENHPLRRVWLWQATAKSEDRRQRGYTCRDSRNRVRQPRRDQPRRIPAICPRKVRSHSTSRRVLLTLADFKSAREHQHDPCSRAAVVLFISRHHIRFLSDRGGMECGRRFLRRSAEAQADDASDDEDDPENLFQVQLLAEE